MEQGVGQGGVGLAFSRCARLVPIGCAFMLTLFATPPFAQKTFATSTTAHHSPRKLQQGLEQGVGLACWPCFLQPRTHWARFFVCFLFCFVFVFFFGHKGREQGDGLAFCNLAPLASAAPSKGLSKGLALLSLAPEPALPPLVALFCRQQSGRRFCATSPFAPKNLVASTHLAAHHHQEDQPGQQQRARGWPCFFTREPASHPLVPHFCRLNGVAGFSPHHH